MKHIGYAFNRTRQSFLATRLQVADTHLTRLRGLVGTRRCSFAFGAGLLIVPCRGVHTIGMSYPIDVVYLDRDGIVVHLEEKVKPWRITPVRVDSASVLELPAHTVWVTGTEEGDRVEVCLSAGFEAAGKMETTA